MPEQLNKEWHQKHPLPRNATLEERIKWHLQHVKHCGCRPLPEKIKEELIRRDKK